ncbi:MAG: ketosteroid isomerase-related protein [Bacteriovoracia bacterium]
MKNTTTIIENYYRAFNEKRFADMLALLHPNVVHDINQGERQKGKATFTTFMEGMNRHYDELLTDMVVMASADGKRGSAEFICNGTYLSTAEGLPPARGQKYRLPVGAFFDVEEGLITRVTNYYNLQDWIDQVNK